jgi:transposase-like protein
MDTFTEKRFNNDDAARAYLEGLRWPDGPVCPHCGVVGHAYAIKPAGTYRCAEAACRKNFTVTMNSPMERSHIALHKWVLAFHLICSSKKGMSAHQLHRTLGITYRSAWFMAHRIRECMRAGGLAAPIGGSGKTVEADETYFGTIPKAEIMPRSPNKKATGRRTGISRPAYRAVVALVERGGNARTFHVASADQNTVSKIMRENVAKETRIHTDESPIYNIVPWQFPVHETIKHKDYEYVAAT